MIREYHTKLTLSTFSFMLINMKTKEENEYHHGDLRAALVAAAAQMIAEEGIDSVTMRTLGERLGVSRTAPYRHFADKEAILAAVAAEGFQRLQECLQEIEARQDLTPLLRFQQMGIAYICFAAEHPTYYRLMFSMDRARAENYPELVAASQPVFGLLVTAIQQCQEAEMIRTDDARALAHVVWSTVHGLSLLWIDGQLPRSVELQTLSTFATQTLIDGLRKKN
jgi:AcrR family transcriptional regulator